MREEKVRIPMSDGTADGYLYAPDGAGPWPGVLYYPHGLGIDSGFHIMSRRLAGEGYVVLLPNIYYRTTAGTPFPEPIDFSAPATRQRFMELSGPLTADVMEQDAIDYLDFLDDQDIVQTGPMGTVGYCLTGKMAIRTAAAAPDVIGAAASFHGGGLYTDAPDSPHLQLPRIESAHLYFGHAQNDNGMTAEAIGKLEAALAAWGGRFESETYPALHGWTVPGGHVYDAEQAERHFDKLTELFDGALG
jgi:carboxymethylenebutenolidase